MNAAAIATIRPVNPFLANAEPDWADVYVEKLRLTGMPGEARSAAMVSKRAVETRYASDIEFQEAVDDARNKWADVLEKEAFRRAVTGVPKGVYFKGEKVDEEYQYSDSLLSKMLEAHRRELYGKEVTLKGTGPGGAITVNIRRFDEKGNVIESAATPHPQSLPLQTLGAQDVYDQRQAHARQAAEDDTELLHILSQQSLMHAMDDDDLA